MKAEEIRIGLWLRDVDGPFQVTDAFFTLLDLNLNHTYPLSIDFHILIKNGFKQINNDVHEYSLGNFRYSVKKISGAGWLFCDGNKALIDFKYIHELQNIWFALTKEELLFNL